jgi:hypothetical protein
MTKGVIACIIGGVLIVAAAAVGITALVAHGNHGRSAPVVQVHVHNNNNQANAPAPAPAAPAAPAATSGPFSTDVTALASSVADEQANQLSNAPSDAYGYDVPGSDITVSCTPNGDTAYQYSCTGADTDGDTGNGDIVTVSPDGSSWSDTGMTWSGPDVSVGYWTTGTVSGYTGS